jgi:hypothetical protein
VSGALDVPPRGGDEAVELVLSDKGSAQALLERSLPLRAGQNRATQRRPPAPTTPADPDAAPRRWLRGWANNHPRRGSPNADHDAHAEGWTLNHKKIQRL